jgi:hypothetical protein
MRSFPSSFLAAVLASSVMSGCSGSGASSGSPTLVPSSEAARAAGPHALLQRPAPFVSVVPDALLPHGTLARPPWMRIKKPATGVYVAEFSGTEVLGYQADNENNKKAACTIHNKKDINDVDTDPQGNLIVPDGFRHSVQIYAGPSMCGKLTATITDPDGQPSDVATLGNGAPLYVGNIFGAGATNGDVAICTLTGCGDTLTDPSILEIIGVAVDAAGNVYASYYNQNFAPQLMEFPSGTAPGTTIATYPVSTPGGIAFDASGNLVVIDPLMGGTGVAFVMSGCPSTCTASGPFSLKGSAVFGKFDATGDQFAVADFTNGSVDVYAYAGSSGISYQYSYHRGLSVKDNVEGIAESPALSL